jgi:hypothetical protein
MEAAITSETSVNFYQTTRRNNPEDNRLQEKEVTILGYLFFFLIYISYTRAHINDYSSHLARNVLSYF